MERDYLLTIVFKQAWPLQAAARRAGACGDPRKYDENGKSRLMKQIGGS